MILFQEIGGIPIVLGGYLYVMDVGGLVVRRLETGMEHHNWPAWFPDGQRILFSGFHLSSGWQLYVMHLDGSGLRKLTSDAAGAILPALSSDGAQVVYMQGANGNGPLVIMDSSGANARPLGVSGGRAAWSPDGTQLAFSAGLHLTRLNLVTLAYDTLGRNYSIDSPSWSPDAQRIITSGSLGIVVQDPATPAPSQSVGFLGPTGSRVYSHFGPSFAPARP